jgi:hypothetical protein
MIIFNLWAIPVVFVIYLIVSGLVHFWPGVMTDTITGWTTGIVSTIVGAVCHAVGIKARLFFLPIWMIGLGIICFNLGWPGTIGFVALLVVAGIWFFKGAKKKELADWQKVQEEAVKNSPPSGTADENQFWSWVEKTLFLPTWLELTPELCQHNLKVLLAIKQSGVWLDANENAKLNALGQFLARAQTATKPPQSEVKIQNLVYDLINNRLRKARKSGSGGRLVRPPVIPAAR